MTFAFSSFFFFLPPYDNDCMLLALIKAHQVILKSFGNK